MKTNSSFKALEVKKNKGLQVLNRVQRLSISSLEDYEKHAEALRKITEEIKLIEAKLQPIVSSARQTWQNATNLRKETLAPWQDAQSTLKDVLGRYMLARRREEERKRIEKQQQAEAKAERDRQREIEKAKKSGDKELAKELKEAPLVVPTVTAPSLIPKGNGISIREIWDFQITDPGLLPRDFLKPDEVAIRRRVNELGELAKIPGVKTFKKTSVAQRT